MLHVIDDGSSSDSSSESSDDALIPDEVGKRKRGDHSRDRSVASRSEQSYFAPSAAGSALSTGSPIRAPDGGRDEAAAGEVALQQITEMTDAIDQLLQGGPNSEQSIRTNQYQYSAFQTAQSIGPGGLHTLHGVSESLGVVGANVPMDIEQGAEQYIISTPVEATVGVAVPDGMATVKGGNPIIQQISDRKFCGREKFSKISVRTASKKARKSSRRGMPTLAGDFVQFVDLFASRQGRSSSGSTDFGAISRDFGPKILRSRKIFDNFGPRRVEKRAQIITPRHADPRRRLCGPLCLAARPCVVKQLRTTLTFGPNR